MEKIIRRNPLLWQWVSFLIIIIWMSVIFHFSAQPAEVSSDLSGHVSYSIAQRVGQWTDQDWGKQDLLQLAETIEFPVRKAAHMTEYGILAALFLFLAYIRAQGSMDANGKMQSLWKLHGYKFALFCAFLYACTDEFHQTFVPGRDGSPRDVCIDTVGALLALLVVYKLTRIVRKSCGEES